MITEESRQKMGWRKGKQFSAYTKSCEVCGNLFITTPTSKKQYCCSVECSSQKKKKEKVKGYCKTCGADIEFLRSRNKVYCSSKCKIEGLAKQRKEKYERKWQTHKAIKQYLIEKDAKCQICGWKKEVNILECHHKDRNRRNNTEDNLQLLCPTCHTLEHYKTKTGQFHQIKKEEANAINKEGN